MNPEEFEKKLSKIECQLENQRVQIADLEVELNKKAEVYTDGKLQKDLEIHVIGEDGERVWLRTVDRDGKKIDTMALKGEV